MTSYRVQLSEFEGPLDLLLQLVERRRLEITTISLSLVVDQYLEHLAGLEESDLDAWSEFVVIAARLLLIKSRAILPPPRPPQEAPPPEDALAEQLRQYRSLRDGIHFLRARDEAGLRSFAVRRRPLVVTEGRLVRYTPAELRSAYARALARQRDEHGIVERQVISVGDKIEQIQSALAGRRSLLFDEVLRSCRSRTEVVVCFLALLELIKRKLVRAEQAERYGAIVVEGVEPDPATP